MFVSYQVSKEVGEKHWMSRIKTKNKLVLLLCCKFEY